MGLAFARSRHEDAAGGVFIVREALAADAAQVVRYTRATLAENLPGIITRPDEFRVTVAEERRQLARSRRDEGDIFLLAVRPGRRTILGTLRGTSDSRLRVRHTLTFGITVARRARGLGIGRTLIARTIAWADSHPYITRLALTVIADNPARHLYASLGFIEEGRRTGYVQRDDGTFVDMILMCRRRPADEAP